ncbi:MAG: hypothetical protein V3T58_03555 [Candidatus Hydrothermarchaeales archaeon]
MTRLLGVLLIVALLIAGCVSGDQKHITFSELVSQSRRYSGKEICTEGYYLKEGYYLNNAFEVSALGESYESAGYGFVKHKEPLIWIRIEEPLAEDFWNQLKNYTEASGSYFFDEISVCGKFEYGEGYGHLGGYEYQIKVAEAAVIGTSTTKPKRSMPHIPDDFEVVYSSQALYVPWGGFSYHIYRDGFVIYHSDYGHLTKDFREDLATFVLTGEELFSIYRSILDNDFFGLDEYYTDPTVVDGGTTFLNVTADNKTHQVWVQNADVPSFNAVTETINNIVAKMDF